MSAITGIYRCDRTSSADLSSADLESDLRQMMDTIAYRGPDKSGVWRDREVALGHQMLWTTPESLLEELPLAREGISITADARIDNRIELIAALELSQPATQITDSDIILAAYIRWGEHCSAKLVGDFAFVIWDSQQKQLFCARDHMGIRSLCYYYQPQQLFAFASDVKALLCLPAVPHRINETKIADYLASLFIDKASTFFDEIFYLPPASYAIVTPDKIRIETYWSLDQTKELKLGSDEDYAAALKDTFTEAVRCRLRSAFPIGTHLSGGLDSSSVTCVARQILPEACTLHTFSNIFETTADCDERPYIDAVLAQEKLTPHFVAGDAKGPLSDLDFAMNCHSGIVAAPNHFLLLGLGEAAQQAGVRIILDGSDGDTTLSHGLDYLSELAYQGNWAKFASETAGLKQVMHYSPSQILYTYGFGHLENLLRSGRWIAFMQQSYQLTQHFNLSWQRLLVRHGIKPLVPKRIRRIWHTIRGDKPADRKRANSVVAYPRIINHSFARRSMLEARSHTHEQHSSRLLTTQREGHYLGLNSSLLTHAVEIIQDYSAAFGIETRSPFMDKRLVEFCLSLPPEQKLRQGWTRYVMRQAMKMTLPDEIWQRADKAQMGSSVFYGLLHHNKGKTKQIMEHAVPLVSQYLSLDAVQALHDQLASREKRENAVDHSDLIMFYRALTLAYWLKKE